MSAHLKVAAVVGARPNFMKTAPVLAELGRRGERFRTALIHTGQHYDHAMSEIFVQELGVKRPDHLLDIGSGTHAQQTARAMERIEPILEQIAPDIVLVPGDVNSTLAATLVAAKLGIPVAHIEAGLRSFDRGMPEEINRVLTDQLANLLFIHSPEARENLVREGRDDADIDYAGNTMIDMLVCMRERIAQAGAARRHGLRPGDYLVVTLHRPALVDGPLLERALSALQRVARDVPVVFPMHPRTRKTIERNRHTPLDGVRVLEPMGYLEFLSLVEDAAAVLTDSGGIQEETTFLGIPCFTLRANTERPVTCTLGTNVLLGLEPERILEIPTRLAADPGRHGRVPAGWDGAAAGRIVDTLERSLGGELERSAGGGRADGFTPSAHSEGLLVRAP